MASGGQFVVSRDSSSRLVTSNMLWRRGRESRSNTGLSDEQGRLGGGHDPGVWTVQVIISGRFQGVGYRAWAEDQAIARGLSGWVRNRRDNSVEAVFSGEAAAVEAMIDTCRAGPRLAMVDDVAIVNVTKDPSQAGFRILLIT